MHLSPQLTAWAERHHGLITLDAWTAAGGTRTDFYRRLRHADLQVVATGVAALPGTPIGPLRQIAAAVLRHGPGVMVSDRSAAVVWAAGIVGTDPVDLLSTRDGQRTNDTSVRIHLPADRRTLRGTTRQGLPCTSPLPTLRDLAASSPDDVQVALESFLRARLVTLPAARAALGPARIGGRRGATALARALDAVGPVVTDSELESVLRRLFVRAGLSGWVFHDRVEGYEVDFCFRHERLIVEVDGWGAHGAIRSRWEQTIERDAQLTALGWLSVHLTWRMVTQRPDTCIRQLRSSLDQRR